MPNDTRGKELCKVRKANGLCKLDVETAWLCHGKIPWPHLFLTIVRGKTLAFAGDSIARNQMESLLCLLSQVNTLCFSSSKCVTKGRLAFNLRKPISPVTQLQ